MAAAHRLVTHDVDHRLASRLHALSHLRLSRLQRLDARRHLQRHEAVARGDEPDPDDELFEEPPLPMETTTTESELRDAKGEWQSRKAMALGLQARLDVMLKAEAHGHG